MDISPHNLLFSLGLSYFQISKDNQNLCPKILVTSVRNCQHGVRLKEKKVLEATWDKS